jgi:hypothetical protein
LWRNDDAEDWVPVPRSLARSNPDHCGSSEFDDIRMMWIVRSHPDSRRVFQHSSMPDMGDNSTLVINTLTSRSDLMKSRLLRR